MLIRILTLPALQVLRGIQFVIATYIFFHMALAPAGETPSVIHPWALHFIGNFLLITSGWVGLFPRFHIKHILIMCCIFSISAELGQSFTASRVTDPFDLIANFIGLCCGLLVCVLGERILRKYNQSAS